MFADWDNHFEEDETLEVLKRYQEMLFHHDSCFFDLHEYECIIDFYVEQLNLKDALSAIKLAIKQHPYASSIKLKYIQLLIESGKPAKALGIIKSLGNAESSNYQKYLAKGLALNLTGKHEDAGREFARALQMCQDGRDEIAYSIAHSYLQLGRMEQTIKYLSIAYRHNKDNILVLYDLALNYEKIGYPEKGIFFYDKYLDRDPFAEHIWNNMGMLYQKIGEFEKAARAFDMALAINPDFYQPYFAKARMLTQNKNIGEAIRVYDELLTVDSANVKAMCELGNCYNLTENDRDALSFYRKALKINKDCCDAWYGMGKIYCRQGKFKQCVSSLKKATVIQPGNADYWNILGKALKALKKIDEAIHAYSKAAELNPLDLETYMACAHLLFRKKRYEEATSLLVRILKFYHDHPVVIYALAATYTYKGDIHNAMIYFKKGISVDFQAHKEMFKHFPKTRQCQAFQHMVENHPGNK